MKKHYLRSTRNLYFKIENGINIFYSYSIFAFVIDGTLTISENVWSVTLLIKKGKTFKLD